MPYLHREFDPNAISCDNAEQTGQRRTLHGNILYHSKAKNAEPNEEHQVITRFKASPRDQTKGSRLMVIDQLWLWILNEGMNPMGMRRTHQAKSSQQYSVTNLHRDACYELPGKPMLGAPS